MGSGQKAMAKTSRAKNSNQPQNDLDKHNNHNPNLKIITLSQEINNNPTLHDSYIHQNDPSITQKQLANLVAKVAELVKALYI